MVTPASRAAAYNSFTIEHAQEVLGKALACAGVHDVEEFRPLRAPADNAIIYVPQFDSVARIAADPAHRSRLAREITAAIWLSDHDIPTVVPTAKPPTPQLEVIDGRVISWWDYLPSNKHGSLRSLGILLRRMHSQTNRPSLATLDPWARVEHQIEVAAQALPAGDIDLLTSEYRRLIDLWNASEWRRAQPSMLHGDAYTGNTLVVNGRTHLLDFEDTAIGPAQWDFASVLGAHQLGWVDTADYEEFCRGYDADLMDYPEIDVLVDISLFRRCCWFASRAGRDATIIDAVRHRISTLSKPHHLKNWNRGGL